jgi:hypothetical protein
VATGELGPSRWGRRPSPFICQAGGAWVALGVARVALGQTKRHPSEPLSCKGLRHVWRVRHLFFTFWGRTKSRKKILRTAHRYFLVEDRALTTRHTCHTCLNALCHKGFRVRRFGSTCSTQAPPCTQSASLPVATTWPRGGHHRYGAHSRRREHASNPQNPELC